MDKTLYYYNCIITHNDRATNIHLNDLLDRIIVENPPRRLKHIKQGNICLLDMDPPNQNRDVNDRKVVFGKYRENKPYLGNIGTDRIDEIADDVLELTSVFYQRNNRLMIVEYNHNGARPAALQNYLSTFLPVSDEDSWGIRLEPIEPELGFQDIQQSTDIREVVFKVDLTARDRTLYAENADRSVLGNLLNDSVETHEDFGANVAFIGFSNGRKRRDVINPDQLIPLLRGLNLDGDVFQSVRVKYLSPTSGIVENINVKDVGVLKSEHDFENTGWLAVCNEIEEIFYDLGRAGQGAYNNYQFRPADLPELIFRNPPEENEEA